jgi:hypothetical protein
MPKLNYSNLWTFDLYGPLRNALMRANPLLGQVRGGWALEIKTFLSPMKWHRTFRRMLFPGPYPLPLAQVMDLPASKALHTGPFQSQVNGYFYVHELPGPIARLWGTMREHSAVNFSNRTAPPPPPSAVNLITKHIRNHPETVKYIKERSGLVHKV